MAEVEKDNLFLTDAEVQFIEESIQQTQNESGEDDVFSIDPSSMKWSLSVTLQQFAFTLTEKLPQADTHDKQPEFLTAELFGLKFSLMLTPKVDHELRDVFEWRFFGALDKFEANQLGKPMIFFQRGNFHAKHSSSGSFHEAEESIDSSSMEAITNTVARTESNSIEVMNVISREGHTMHVKIYLLPLVLKIRPIFIRKFASFFTFEASEHFAEELRKIQEMQISAGLEERGGFLGDYMAEQAEKFKSRVVEQQEDAKLMSDQSKSSYKQFVFDLNMSAPILILEDGDIGSLKFHLGTARIWTENPSRVNDIVLNMALRETQLRYVWTGGKSLLSDERRESLKRFHSMVDQEFASSEGDAIFEDTDKIAVYPIPVSIELRITNLQAIELEFVADQLLVDLEPSLIKLLVSVPQLLLREFHSTDARGTSASPPVAPTTVAIPPSTPVLDFVSSEDVPASSDVKSTSAGDQTDDTLMREVELAALDEADQKTKKQHAFDVNVYFWMTRGALRVRDAKDSCTMHAEAAGLAGSWKYAGQNSESLTKLGMGELKLLDPRKQACLFTTLTATERTITRREKQAAWDALDTSFQQRFGRTDGPFAFSVLNWVPGMKNGEIDDFLQWLPPQLGARLQTTLVDDKRVSMPNRYVALTASPIEAHWHRASIQANIATTEDLMSALREAAKLGTKAAPELTIDILTPSAALPSLQETLNLVMLNLKGPSGVAPTMPKEETHSEDQQKQLQEDQQQQPGSPNSVDAALDGTLPRFIGTNLHSTSIATSMIIDASVKSVAISFWDDHEIFWRMSLQDLDVCKLQLYETEETQYSMTIGWSEISVHNRCVLAPRLSENNRYLMNVLLRQYASNHPSLASPLNYSTCLLGNFSSIDYVYFQQDLSKLVAYLSGSVLETLLWKSYEAAKELASKSFFLYEFRIDRPRFILSEDKSAIPQTYYRHLFSHSSEQSKESPRTGGFRSWSVFEKYGNGTKAKIEKIMNDLRGSPLPTHSPYQIAVNRKPIDLFYLGSYLELDLGALRVRNRYTADEHNASETDNRETVTSVLFNLQGLTISAKHHPMGSYKDDIADTLLSRVIWNFKVHWTNTSPVYLDGWTSELSLRLTRPQLSLVLDVMNENLSGGGYQPQPVTITNQEYELEQIKASLERPPFKLSVRLRAPAIKLETYFTPSRPVALVEIVGIYLGCDVNIYSAFNVYSFGLYGKRFAVIDKRHDSVNTYRTFLESRKSPDSQPQSAATRGGKNDVSCKMTWGEEHSAKSQNLAKQFPWLPPEAFVLSWMRPGMRENESRSLDDDDLPSCSDVYYPFNFSFDDQESVRIYFSSCLSRSRFEIALIQPVVCVLAILAMDVFDFVTSGLAFSSMKNYPKPIAAVVNAEKRNPGSTTQSTPSEAKTALGRVALPENLPFLFAVNIVGGSFLLLSDIRSTSSVWRWQTDFTFEGLSDQNGVVFNDLSLPGGKLDLVPHIYAADSHEIRTCCASFEVLGRGKYKGLFDPVIQEKPLGANQARLFQLSGPLQEFLMDTDTPAIFVGEAFFAFSVPTCSFKLTGRDWGALVSAVRCIMQDQPAASDGIPVPPIMPPIYDETQATVKIHVDPSEQSMFRFFNVDLNIYGLTCTFCDDFRSSVVPMMRASVQSQQISFRYSPAAFLITTEDTEIRVEYLNTVIGLWEPFVEKLSTKIAWRSAVPLQRVLRFHRETLATQRLRRAELLGGYIDPVLTAVDHFPWDSLKSSKQRMRPTKSVRFASSTPMYVNITPRLVQLALWIVPYVTKHLRQEEEVSTPSSSKDDRLVSAAFKCLNLSGSSYMLTRIAEGDSLRELLKADSVAATLSTVIVPDSRPSKLDSFLSLSMKSHIAGTVQDLEVYEDLATSKGMLSGDSDPKEGLYLTALPPAELVKSTTRQLRFQLPDCEIEHAAVQRCLITTRCQQATLSKFAIEAGSNKRLREHNQDTTPISLDPCPAILGPLPKDSRAFSISLNRASAVNLPNPFSEIALPPVTIAEVISPHPSFQLFLLSTTVRVFNHSGLPLQIAFWNESDKPIKLLAPLTDWRAPAEHLSARMSQMAVMRRTAGAEDEMVTGVGLSTMFEPDDIPEIHPCVEEWGLDPNEFPIKRSDKFSNEPAERYLKPESSFPVMQVVDDGVIKIADIQPSSYSLVLPPNCFLSVPPTAFEKDGRVRLVFRPLGFLIRDACRSSGKTGDGFDAEFQEALTMCLSDPEKQGNGWCTPIDTIRDFGDIYEKNKGFMISELGIYAARYCQYYNGASSFAAQKSTSFSSKLRNKKETDDKQVRAIAELQRLFFEICLMKRTTSLPAEADIKEIAIFPALTGINASPMHLEVSLANEKIHNRTIMCRGTRIRDEPIYFERPRIERSICPGQTFHFYDVPPPSMTRQILLGARTVSPELGKKSAPTQLRMPRHRVCPKARVRNFIKDAFQEDRQYLLRLLADDSDSFEQLEAEEMDSDDDDEHQASVSRIFIEGKLYAPICLELRKEARDVAAVLPRAVDPRQQVFVISAPSWFVDRTGRNIMPQDYDKPYPQSSENPRIRLLEDSLAEGQQAVHLVMPIKGEGDKTLFPQIRAEVPPAGGFSSISMGAGNKFLALVIRTSKIRLCDTAGALSRIVTVLPKYILTNLCPWMLLIRQAEAKHPLIKLSPKESHPMYWGSQDYPLHLEFKPNLDYYEWSAHVIPSEVVAGETHIALHSKHKNSPAFSIRVCPEDGVFSVVFTIITPTMVARSQTGVFVHNQCPKQSRISVSVRPLHPELQSVVRGKPPTGALPTFTKSVSLAKAGDPGASGGGDSFVKVVTPECTDVVAWPLPFITASRVVSFHIFLNNDYVAPQDPMLLNCNLDTFRSKHYDVKIGKDALNEACLSVLTSYCNAQELTLTVILERKGDRVNILVKPRLFVVPSLPRPVRRPAETTSAESDAWHTPTPSEARVPTLDLSGMEFVSEIRMAKMGVSLVSEKLKEELLFAEICQLSFVSGQRGDSQTMNLKIADVQLDSQLERSEKPVLLANRGTTSKLASQEPLPKTPVRTGSSTAGALDSTAMEVPRSRSLKKDESLVEEKPFLSLKIDRPTLASRDLILREVRLTIDDVEVDLDVEVLNGISDFYNECLKSLGYSFSSSGVTRAEILEFCKQDSVLANFVPPKLPQLVVLEKLHISRFTLHAWCSFLLDRISWIGDTMIFLLKVLMASGRLELKGAPIEFKDESITDNSLRGSSKSVVSTLVERYSAQVFNSIATLVGYSSLLNIPRAPMELLRGTVGVGLGLTDQAASGLSSIMSNLTFDKDYINKRQRERQDAKKASHNLSTGLQAAKQNLQEGVVAMGNVFVKPWEGGRKEGFGGFMKGIGTGVMGTLIKPVDKVGQALSNVATGIRAEYVSKPIGAKKMVTKRRRKPRMLWGEHGQLRDYDPGDADIRELLGLRFAKNVLQCITLEHKTHPPRHLVLVFYPKEVSLLDLALKRSTRRLTTSQSTIPATAPALPSPPATPKPAAASASFKVATKGTKLWSVNITEVEQVVATTHGVLINLTDERRCQVPCSSDRLIRRVAAELSNAQKRLRSEVIVSKLGLTQPSAFDRRM
eukprot:Gregarina_sp_Poly_1__1586@NODE_13_length_23366_cov_172_320786_g11_i0_p1_GENE_NODE_13_length_23366_cov_172_320786_g11_i0NODE_13_length_23366_cov_172_320786_g11_i0_p1_ORF_typecomplete_len4110_score635_11Chorein_N/PF12624_7/8_2e19Chorein_N/PF12624_7/1_7e03SHRBD/PF06650_12/4_7e03SHRBD/PF06650_12/5_5e17VPS13/PF16908_5/1_8e11VPS13/PF16908_5/1_3e03ATG_C/PF09333_11/3e09VPS13_C/PF16909_5/1_4VPS13_C/PF16909_5/61VPS13_C/PF16909_5/72TDRP/PF15683_5/0_26_NODE_13_length_23366_cov_172_320786_g11_i0159812331